MALINCMPGNDLIRSPCIPFRKNVCHRNILRNYVLCSHMDNYTGPEGFVKGNNIRIKLIFSKRIFYKGEKKTAMKSNISWQLLLI